MDKKCSINWLENNRNIIPYSVNRYANAIDTIASDLGEYGLTESDLYNVIDTAIIDTILANCFN